MKKNVRRISALQRERTTAINRKVFKRIHAAIVECAELDRNAFSWPVMGFLSRPMQFKDFGALMANTKTHKRNNK